MLTARLESSRFSWLVTYWMQVLLSIIIVFVLGYYLWPRHQSFTIQASTQSLSVTTANDLANAWDLSEAILCQRVSIPADGADARCEPAFYEGHDRREGVSLVWPVGYRLTVRGGDAEFLAVEIRWPDPLKVKSRTPLLFDGIEVADNSVLLFPRSVLQALGTLPLVGSIGIGDPPHPGASRLLRSGNYEIRERLVPWSRPTMVASGDFRFGDNIAILGGGAEVPVEMLLAQPEEGSRADFELVLTSPEVQSHIELTRVGGASAAIATRWTDRVSSDALPLALAGLLTLLTNSLNVIQEFTRRRGPERPNRRFVFTPRRTRRRARALSRLRQ